MAELIGRPPPEDGNIEDRVNHVVDLLDWVKTIVGSELSVQWEQDYDFKDLEEEVWRLKQQLKLSIPLGDRVNPPTKSQTALERDNEKRIDDLTKTVKGLQLSVKKVKGQRDELRSKNWELEYRCRDLQEDVWRLEMKMRSSIMLGDSDAPVAKVKTALEKDLEERILVLEEKLEKVQGRSRSGSF